jgi:hypothetical protein
MRSAALWVIFLASLALRGAESASNTVHWLAPSNSMAASRWPWKWKSPFAIATNTPAFEAYGLNFMLAAANEMREKWRLDIQKPLVVDDVLFAVCGTARGIEGHLRTRDGRFQWDFDHNVPYSFMDIKYQPASFRYHDEESARLAKIKSKITAKKAELIARSAFYQLSGMTEEQLGWQKVVQVHQYKFEETDGTVYPLPIFHVGWKYEGPTRFAAANIEATPLEMDVSGITENVAYYDNFNCLRLDSLLPRPLIPTNYFKMLGLPDNYLETAPEGKRRLWGLPPLTNSPASTANPSVHDR